MADQRICALVDVRGDLPGTDEERARIRGFLLPTALEVLSAASGTAVTEFHVEDRGDGVVAVLPGLATMRFLERTVREFRHRLEEFNAAHPQELRVHLALDGGGPRETGRERPSGAPLSVVSRLADNPEADERGQDVTLSLSDGPYRLRWSIAPPVFRATEEEHPDGMAGGGTRDLFQQLCEQALRRYGPAEPARRSFEGARRAHPAVMAARAAAGALTVLLAWSFAQDLRLGDLPGWGRDLWAEDRLPLQAAGLAVAAVLWRWPRRRAGLSPPAALARRNLDHLRYETTATRGGEAGVMQMKLTGSRARRTHRWTMPELVGHLTRFLTEITKAGDTVLIGIDEVDRIGDVAKAEQFISEIKSVFRVPDCHFVVSVAEEVGSLFARRAIVGRSMFENAFEEIVVVQPLSHDEAAKLLQLRVPGFSRPFVHLAYGLSGGLPRELLRVTRHLIEVNTVRRPVPRLPELARLMVRDELREAIDGTRLRLAQLPGEAEWGALFSDLTERLTAFSPDAALSGLPGALADLADLADLATPEPSTPAGEALAGLTAFADFGRTAVAVFDGFAPPSVPAAATGPARYTRLAAARRELSLSPTSCRRILAGLRAELTGTAD